MDKGSEDFISDLIRLSNVLETYCVKGKQINNRYPEFVEEDN